MTPQIIVCENDKNLASLLLTALASVQGHPCEVFVKSNGTEQIVILLPTPGPSLAAALRDWVHSWWSDGDAATYGTPESYCATFGVIIPTDKFASFSPSCPYCGADTLYMTSGTFQAMGLLLNADGFAFDDADNVQTADEQVTCSACERTFSLQAVLL